MPYLSQKQIRLLIDNAKIAGIVEGAKEMADQMWTTLPTRYSDKIYKGFLAVYDRHPLK